MTPNPFVENEEDDDQIEWLIIKVRIEDWYLASLVEDFLEGFEKDCEDRV